MATLLDNSVERLEEEVDSDNESISEQSTDGNTSEKDSDDERDSGENTFKTNLAWADSVSKILRTNKPKGKKTIVLSKAKKITGIKTITVTPDPGFEVDGEIKEEKPGVENELTKSDPSSLGPPRKKKKELPTVRIKPNILDRDRERTLSKIATKGVVQLFNAVRMQQNDISTRLKQAGPLERKRTQVLKSFDKRSFLDVLMGQKSESVDGGVKDEDTTKMKVDASKTEQSDKTENGKVWDVLREDFMMGAKLKDWDKDDSDSDVQSDIIEMSDSD